MSNNSEKEIKVYETCPHCGQKLSPWQQVLLRVDRAIVCKNCWYRIIINAYEGEEEKPSDKNSKTETGNKDGVV